jgi:penicillin-binding protein 1C
MNFMRKLFQKIGQYPAIQFARKYLWWVKRRYVLGVFLLWYIFALPNPLFRDGVSTVLEDAQGTLLGARIAADGQWRFPAADTVPAKFAACIVAFEDRYFYQHIGINPAALFRAIGQNIKNRKVVSGGSTLSMQTIRMARKVKSRNIFSKLLEATLATRLELRYSKREILSLYAANAPFGGNVVGLEAASWRYFGKSPQALSWGESATLAVLPNAPALIHFGRNRAALLAKRNRLLDKLAKYQVLDGESAALAKAEPLPEAPLPLPQLATHLLDRAYQEQVLKKAPQPPKGEFSGRGARIVTTLDATIQQQVNNVLRNHHLDLADQGIHNLAAIVLDVQTNTVVAYVGNAPLPARSLSWSLSPQPSEGGRGDRTPIQGGNEGNSSLQGAGRASSTRANPTTYGEEVDIIRSLRSTGSVLKPLLYAYAQQEGVILPNSLLQDVPTDLGNYHPENFHETYDGVIPARRALARSLNIPFIRLLQTYGLEKFHFNLKKLGITTVNKPAEFYGLTMIVGGAEGSLWELTNTYASVARTALHWYTLNNRYNPQDWQAPTYLYANSLLDKNNLKNRKKIDTSTTPTVLNAAAAWLALDAMKEVERPDAEGNWELFENAKTVAWKTGTSFGFRDAWAIGVTPRYAVGVWVGNANGEGRPGLIGVEKAAPILFDIFNLLKTNDWFSTPYDDMTRIVTCRQSGYRATDLCETTDTVWACKGAERVAACPYHQLLHLDKTAKYQVSSDCEQPENMLHRSWFALPPLEEYYHRPKNPGYQPPPPYRADCARSSAKINPMQLIYPKSPARILVPRELDGAMSATIFRVAHREGNVEIFWHLDNEFVGSTKTFHQLSVNPTIGKHRLTVVDGQGNRLEQNFEVIGERK